MWLEASSSEILLFLTQVDHRIKLVDFLNFNILYIICSIPLEITQIVYLSMFSLLQNFLWIIATGFGCLNLAVVCMI